MNFKGLIKTQLCIIGKPFTIQKGNETVSGRAVIEQTWRKNKTRFEKNTSKIGRYFKDYYNYIGPYDVEIDLLTEDDILTVGNESYFFVQTEKVTAGGKIQYYRGILRKLEGDENAFAVID